MLYAIWVGNAGLTKGALAIRIVNDLKYLEPLPDGCPPDDAEEIVEPRIVYRLVRSAPPSRDDFRSLRSLNPGLVYEDADTECRANGVSVFIDLEFAHRRRRERRNLRGMLICEVVLDKGAGRIQQPNLKSAHCTWWPLADYDILANCQVIA